MPAELTVTREFLLLVQRLRDRQRMYFETRSGDVLQECKRLEREVDAQLRAILNPQQYQQKGMFE